tara:strand:- start:327 stop:569 length:243 start_codon:yes stop_codon:yes gene_type:complete
MLARSCSQVVKNNLSYNFNKNINLTNQILDKKLILIRDKFGDRIVKYNSINNTDLYNKLPLVGATESHEKPIHVKCIKFF